MDFAPASSYVYLLNSSFPKIRKKEAALHCRLHMLEEVLMKQLNHLDTSIILLVLEERVFIQVLNDMV